MNQYILNIKKRVGPTCQLFFLLILFNGALIGQARGQYVYDYNEEVQATYELLMDLQLPAAVLALEKLAVNEPTNLAILHLQNYYDFFVVYTSDEEEKYKALKKQRFDRLAQLSKGPEDSPWHLYSQANIRLQWAFLKFRFGDHWSGFLDVKRAFNLLEENVKRFPDFAPNYKDLGILHALIGTVPDQYQWGVRLLAGLDGSIEEGKKELQQSIKNQQASTLFLAAESRLLYSYLLVYLGLDYEEAWAWITPIKAPEGMYVFQAFIYSNVAFRTGHNDEAVQVLRQAQKRAGWEHFPAMDFFLGNALLRKLDISAEKYFRSFLQNYRGRQDIKTTYHRLAWCALLKGDQKKYLSRMKAVQNVGLATNGRDKDALHASRQEFVPNLALLKARLLFDGGYYENALQVLASLEDKDLGVFYEQLELNYRKGRIYHRQGNWSKALFFYNTVYQRGASQGYYFSCNAALQMGQIFEERGQSEEARIYFERCLAAQAEVYQNSLHMSAKAGLQRIKN